MNSETGKQTTAEQDFYRPGTTKEASDDATEELAKRVALAKAVATNLRLLRDDGTGLEELSHVIIENLRVIGADATDLSALEHRIESIVTAMRLTRELAASMDLEVLERRLASIATALKIIAEADVVKELKAS